MPARVRAQIRVAAWVAVTWIASVLLAALWLTATVMLTEPNAGARARGGREPLGLPCKTASHANRLAAR